ncbi:unnamed protein product [Plutella xylostella]|uniref:(diamondback moth) hypothetical protein n=1 Tax=Plutella xylostella TaxID=51655 RepID=A0A8S4FU91_PLUXY|nr:unnamed protein product [Plutella xylostella]
MDALAAAEKQQEREAMPPEAAKRHTMPPQPAPRPAGVKDKKPPPGAVKVMPTAPIKEKEKEKERKEKESKEKEAVKVAVAEQKKPAENVHPQHWSFELDQKKLRTFEKPDKRKKLADLLNSGLSKIRKRD